MWVKRLGIAVLLAALAVSVLSPEADARKRRNRKGAVRATNVTIDFTDREATLGLTPLSYDRTDFFHGTISRTKRCDGRQMVSVHRASGGAVGDQAVASSTGDWVVEIEDPGTDTYVAKVTGLNKRTNKVCAQGTSAPIEVEDDPGNLFGLPTV